jgi:beta-ureidopropionase / N-carbamoyl-L-amino-acid hydrolase
MPPINGDRLWAALMALAEVGAYTDERTGLRGVNRLALGDNDARGRELVRSWFVAAGLEVRVDRIGNVIGRRPGRDAGAAPVMSGSHIDSVPTGGAFDGALGVLGALEVVRTMNDHQIETERPIEIGFFTEEEGCRFGTDMLGSAVAVGRIPLAEALEIRDRDGKSVGDELARVGWAGPHEPRLPKPHAYVELHIEQGPILAAAGLELGVVTGVQGISWQELTIQGKSAHAGTTPMRLRRDPGLAAARINVAIHELATSGRYGAEARATMGRIDPYPGLVNIVPGRVICTVDLRNPHDGLMENMERDLTAFLRSLEAELGVTITSRQTARTRHVEFSPDVQAVIARHAAAAGLRTERILSGAGHDAQELATLCPTAMIFIPGEYDGISHNPREHSTPKSCTDGANVLYATIAELSGAR